jgi:hypothetical protein
VPGALQTIAWRAAPEALYWLVLSLVTFFGMSAAINIEDTRTRLSLVVLVVGVAFNAAYFLERSLRDYVWADVAPRDEPIDTAGSLPKWLCRNKQYLRAKDLGTGQRRAEPPTVAPSNQEGLWCWLPS